MKSQSIIFFGSEFYTVPVVKKLLDHNLKLVVTTEMDGELVKFCESKGIDYIYTDLKSEKDIKFVLNTKPTVAVLASYGAIIPEYVINSIQNGIINIHPSLLPKYKGPSPIQYTLLKGDTQTGVTLIKLDNKIDHGPILSQSKFDLKGNETAKDLLSSLFTLGAEMTEDLIVKLENGEKLTETPQDHSKETWSYKIKKSDGKIDIDNLQATIYKLQAMIRAFYPWPTVWFRTNLKGKVKLIKLLPDDKIQVEGKQPMDYKDFINGYEAEGTKLLEKLGV